METPDQRAAEDGVRQLVRIIAAEARDYFAMRTDLPDKDDPLVRRLTPIVAGWRDEVLKRAAMPRAACRVAADKPEDRVHLGPVTVGVTGDHATPSRGEQEIEMVRLHVDQLKGYFDTVHIFVSSQRVPQQGGTMMTNIGTGEWDARCAQIGEWVIQRIRETGKSLKEV